MEVIKQAKKYTKRVFNKRFDTVDPNFDTIWVICILSGIVGGYGYGIYHDNTSRRFDQRTCDILGCTIMGAACGVCPPAAVLILGTIAYVNYTADHTRKLRE